MIYILLYSAYIVHVCIPYSNLQNIAKYWFHVLSSIFKHCGYIQWLNNINIACFIFRSIYAITMVGIHFFRIISIMHMKFLFFSNLMNKCKILHLFAFWFVNYNLVKYKIMIIILKIMLNINQSISIQCLHKTGGNNFSSFIFGIHADMENNVLWIAHFHNNSI
jgi:hypothetical protein